MSKHPTPARAQITAFEDTAKAENKKGEQKGLF